MNGAHTGLALARLWHHVDAKNVIAGRLATRIAAVLMGKHKPSYMPASDAAGDIVVVTNAAALRFTGRTLGQRVFYSHTGRPGSLRRTFLSGEMERDPARVLRRAVWGMLPKNRIRGLRLSRLHVFAGESHPYTECIARVHSYDVHPIPIS